MVFVYIPILVYWCITHYTLIASSLVEFADCATGSVRLVGGASQYEGRVEYCINGMWGGVCDNGWNDNNADTVCAQLGIKKGIHPHTIFSVHSFL